jgi:C4-type Zn-finger protein
MLAKKVLVIESLDKVITVTFECPVCGKYFDVVGSRYDPPPPPVWTCPSCKADVKITAE